MVQSNCVSNIIKSIRVQTEFLKANQGACEKASKRASTDNAAVCEETSMLVDTPADATPPVVHAPPPSVEKSTPPVCKKAKTKNIVLAANFQKVPAGQEQSKSFDLSQLKQHCNSIETSPRTVRSQNGANCAPQNARKANVHSFMSSPTLGQRDQILKLSNMLKAQKDTIVENNRIRILIASVSAVQANADYRFDQVLAPRLKVFTDWLKSSGHTHHKFQLKWWICEIYINNIFVAFASAESKVSAKCVAIANTVQVLTNPTVRLITAHRTDNGGRVNEHCVTNHPTLSETNLPPMWSSTRVITEQVNDKLSAKQLAAAVKLNSKQLARQQPSPQQQDGPTTLPSPHPSELPHPHRLQQQAKKSTVEEKIGDDNIGNQLLRKMGWAGSGGLGKSADGIEDPIAAEQRTPGRGGIGSTPVKPPFKPSKIGFPPPSSSHPGAKLYQLFLPNLIIRQRAGSSAVTTVNESAQFSHMDFDYQFELGGTALEPQWNCTLLLDGRRVATAAGANQKEAKTAVADAALEWLQKSHPTIEWQHQQHPGNQEGALSRDDLLGKRTVEDEKIGDDNIGNQLLRKMGWAGSGGLGKSAEGIAVPIKVDQRGPGRSGIGVEEQLREKKLISFKEAHNVIRQYVSTVRCQQLVDNHSAEELTFTPELTSDERKIIHNIARKFGLASKSYGSGDKRYLVVSQKKTSAQVLNDLRAAGGEKGGMRLIHPHL